MMKGKITLILTVGLVRRACTIEANQVVDTMIDYVRDQDLAQLVVAVLGGIRHHLAPSRTVIIERVVATENTYD